MIWTRLRERRLARDMLKVMEGTDCFYIYDDADRPALAIVRLNKNGRFDFAEAERTARRMGKSRR